MMKAAAAATAGRGQRELALLVYGATGFTGKYVCEYIAKTLGGSTSAAASSSTSDSGAKLSWGIAGRNRAKLEALAQGLTAKGLPGPHAILVADTADAPALDRAFERAALVLNCTGPYRFLGEEVVTACLRTGTDYADLCGEPEFMDRMLLKYHEEAQATGVLILSACAFDSVPADLGTIFTQRVFAQSGGQIASIESFLTIDTGGHGLHGHVTTFEAAVHGFGSVRDLIRVRREIKRKFPYDDARTVGPPLKAKSGPYYEPRMGRYCFRFPGSDAAVVRASQRMLVLNRLVPAAAALPRYGAYFTVPSAFWAAVVALVGGVFSFLAQREWGRRLLLRHPGFFTCGAFSETGPSEAELAATRFAMTFFAQGYSGAAVADAEQGIRPAGAAAAAAQPSGATTTATAATGSSPLLGSGATTGKPNKFVMTRVSGPEPGYVATPIIFVELARCLLEQRATLAVQGGVYTPGAVFFSDPTLLIERLRQAGVDFAVVQQQ